ncbi:polysaccharide deacetylase [Thermincola ferriacetica]|uniref:Polysaccharide deacetylase n=1 Tax=Thermincola ferriacetica TaxID=281456 RepID=A0A0L6W6K1_9FIRM|nr:polysaccharide deacetylase family protein [Thermincola ferriacetica]KNZ71091.1 polysaccharide deacetylase [Thermincola ferriacetica]
MQKKNLVLIIGVLAFGFILGLNVRWFDQKEFINENRFSLPNSVQRKPEPVSPTQRVPEGWGFVKSRDGKTPEITVRQKQLIKKYGALFVGNTGKKQVTLTFDMGYEKEGLTPAMLDTLKKHNVKASFFVTAHWLRSNRELAKRMVAEGHLLGNHTCSHKSLPTLSEEKIKAEIRGWENVAKEVTGSLPKYKYMRPPMGEYSEKSLRVTQELGYTTAFWSIAMRDWMPMGGAHKAVEGVVNYLHNGAVVLLHGNSEEVVQGLEQIILQTRAKGFKIVPIYEIDK